jgi:hypothetical protein
VASLVEACLVAASSVGADSPIEGEDLDHLVFDENPGCDVAVAA